MFQSIRDLSTKHGPSYFIITQILAWITFIAIYAILATVDFDVPHLLVALKAPKYLVDLAGNKGSWALLTLAFAANRLLLPIRLVAAAFLLPTYGPVLNANICWLQDWWKGTLSNEKLNKTE